MTRLQIESVEEPFLSHADLVDPATLLLSRAEYSGCLPARTPTVLNVKAIAAVSKCLHDAGMPVKPWRLGPYGEGADVEPLRRALSEMNDQLEMSPQPAGEWGPVVESLGEGLLAELIGISESSLRRYKSGTRETPQGVAERLHFLALVLADLAGSYNEYGIRRWFTRPRVPLGGRRPADLLGESFDPEGDDAKAIRGLAASLASLGAA